MKKSVEKMFTNIRNNQGILQISVKNKNIKICKNILKILICKGFIRGYLLNNKNIEVLLKYYSIKPVINKNIIFNSKHFFISYLSLCKLHKNYELIILSTSRGIITHKEALFYKLGGFIICKVS